METTVLTKQHKTAIELNQKIIITAQAAQQNLYDMCVMLKQMRDDKLYKELGYQNFEDYCESEVGFGRMQAHKYIAIIENVKNVNSSLHFGVTKLALLATLSEPEQEQLQQTVNLEDTSVRELKAEIARLKADHKQEIKELSDENTELQGKMKELVSDADTVRAELAEANEKITELESRPVEVAVQDNPESSKKIEELNRKLLDESLQKNKEKKKNGELEERIKKAEKELADLRDINKMQEQRIKNSELASVSPDTKEVFRAYYQHSILAMDTLIGFIREARAANDKNLEFFKGKLDMLVEKFGENLNKIWE